MIIQNLEFLLEEIQGAAKADPVRALWLLGNLSKISGEYNLGIGVDIKAKPTTIDPHTFCLGLLRRNN